MFELKTEENGNVIGVKSPCCNKLLKLCEITIPNIIVKKSTDITIYVCNDRGCPNIWTWNLLSAIHDDDLSRIMYYGKKGGYEPKAVVV